MQLLYPSLYIVFLYRCLITFYKRINKLYIDIFTIHYGVSHEELQAYDWLVLN